MFGPDVILLIALAVSLSTAMAIGARVLTASADVDGNYGHVPPWLRGLKGDVDALKARIGLLFVEMNLPTHPARESVQAYSGRLSVLAERLEAVDAFIALAEDSAGTPDAHLARIFEIGHLKRLAVGGHEEPVVRARAILALSQHMEPELHLDEKVEQAWLDCALVLTDSESLVSLASAYRSSRGSNRVKWVLCDMARYSPHGDVREMAINSLGNQFEMDSIVKALLLDAASKDPSARVRGRAQEFIEEYHLE